MHAGVVPANHHGSMAKIHPGPKYGSYALCSLDTPYLVHGGWPMHNTFATVRHSMHSVPSSKSTISNIHHLTTISGEGIPFVYSMTTKLFATL